MLFGTNYAINLTRQHKNATTGYKLHKRNLLAIDNTQRVSEHSLCVVYSDN